MISVKNGVATIDRTTMGCSETFIGSTAGGVYPPIGEYYDRFSFRPTAGQSGVLVFHHEPAKKDHFFQFFWKKGKLMVVDGLKSLPTTDYQYSRDLGLMVFRDDRWYVTEQPTDTSHNYRVVGVIEMLKYLEGKITLSDLDRGVHDGKKSS